jgi:cytidylate kinase
VRNLPEEGEFVMDLKSSSQRLAAELEKARRHWQWRRGAERPAEAPRPPAPPAFTVAVSREAGAGGASIARLVGAQLGWPVYDQELLAHIAEELGLRAALLEGLDERHVSWLTESLTSLSDARTVGQAGYVRHLVETVLSLGAHGGCVIVGRGAGHVLPRPTTLRVRLVAELNDRVAAFERLYGLSRDQAARRVQETDAERGRFVREYFGKDVADPVLYDLVLNASGFTQPECAALVVEALHRRQARQAAPGAPSQPR